MIRKHLWLIVVNLIFCTLMSLATALTLTNIEWYMQVFAYLCIGIFSFGSIIFLFLKKLAISKTLFIFNVVALITISSFSILSVYGLFETFSNMEKIKQLILESGNLGYLIYTIILLLNVVLLPLPSFVFILAGVAIYGPFTAFILCYISFVVGSIIAFFLGRFFGKKVVYWCVGREQTEKHLKMLGKKGNFLFVIMQVLPFFPDDVLCMVAGLTQMSVRFFIIAMLVLKPLYIFPVCFFGTGSIIPFSGWGIPVWIGIFLLFGICFLLFCKYQNKIEKFFYKLLKIEKK